jgi:hypothetical protein
MKAPWKIQLASDIVRDGLGLELLGEPDRVAAEVFRSDADHKVTVRLFEDDIPDDVLEELARCPRIPAVPAKQNANRRSLILRFTGALLDDSPLHVADVVLVVAVSPVPAPRRVIPPPMSPPDDPQKR